jgi:hypothetical protein
MGGPPGCHREPSATRERGAGRRVCLEPHDLVLSKLAANRERDWEFAQEALAARLVDPSVLLERIGDLPVNSELLDSITASLRALIARAP